MPDPHQTISASTLRVKAQPAMNAHKYDRAERSGTGLGTGIKGYELC